MLRLRSPLRAVLVVYALVVSSLSTAGATCQVPHPASFADSELPSPAADSAAAAGSESVTPQRATPQDASHLDARLSLPEIRVTADRLRRARAAVPMATTTIDRRAIENSGAVNLGELLRPIVGVRVATTGGLGAFTPISIRGSSNDQVVVMVDGRRLNAAQGGGVDLSDISLESIERIEVVRGGASALHGPDALGGVINLVTRQAPAGGRGEFKGEFGSFGTRLVSGALAHGGDAADWRLAGRLLLSDGDYAYRDPLGQSTHRANGQLDARNLDGALTMRPAWAGRLEARASHYHAEKGVPGPTQFPSATATQWDDVTAADLELRGPHAAGLEGLLAHGGTRAQLTAQRQERRYADPAYALGAIDDTHRNDSLQGTLRQDRPLGRLGVLSVGADLRHEHLVSTTDGDRTRRTGSLWARHAFTAGTDARGWTLMPAARYDAVQGFAGRISPKLLGRYAPSAALELRASAGGAFRPPSFDDLFQPARASAAGNPDLRPERSRDFDLGATLRRGAAELAVTGFTNRVTDLIQWQPGASGVWRPHNVAGARLLGSEIEAGGDLALPGGGARRLHLTANYTWLDARDAGDDRNTHGKQLTYRARHRLNAQARLPLAAALEMETQWRYTGSAYVTAANTRALPGYWVGDLLVRWQASREAGLELSLLNLTDALFQDFRDYPVPGRQWRLSGRVAVAR